jgi:predicted ATPase
MNLPCALTSFVGRQHELDRIAAWLRDPAGPRLVTLTGPGGCGKTRLALEVAPRVAELFPDGIWLVELGAASDPAHVPPAVARVLGLPEGPAESALEALISHLATRRVLVVLDNCEHLVAASASLASALLRACPGVRILATSREGLGTDGEVLSRVSPLAMPHPAVTAPQQITAYDAIRLFVDRARDAHPAFELTDLNAGAVVEICRHLDGIPLAIELAAARLAVLSVRQIADRLDDRFRVLTGGRRTALPRQQTLRASVDWSYDLLNETERTLLNRSAVFAEGFTLDAAEAVCADRGRRTDNGGQGEPDAVPRCLFSVPGDAVLDVLTRLVDKSVVVAREQGGVTWYRLLETIRQYAAQKLLASGEAALLHNRHRSWCLASAGRAKG